MGNVSYMAERKKKLKSKNGKSFLVSWEKMT
jgi:hypothetical protein